MPSSNVTVKAKYKNAYYVDVINGTGDGYYAQGDIVTIVADDPAGRSKILGWLLPHEVAADINITAVGAEDPFKIHIYNDKSGF